MRRKWGRKFPFDLLGGGSLPKMQPRKWGSGIKLNVNGSPYRPAPRKWGTRRWFSPPTRSGFTPAKKWNSPPPRKRMKRRHFWLIVAFLVAFAVVESLLFLDRELRKPLMFLAKVRVNQMATEAINAALTDNIAKMADSDKMIRWKTNEAGKITGFEIDYKEQMAITAKAIETVSGVLKHYEDVPERIPIGHALNSPFISSIGPSVSVKFHPASVVKADVQTKQSEMGINMVLVEVDVRIRTEIAVVIPFDQDAQTIETSIPLSFALVVGDVPAYYYDGNGNPVGNGAAQAPPIALPGNPPALQSALPKSENAQ
ncbi:sporulation protein YunB [Cohnella suwonensis]|uniref:Sporulation protein YunB n=1 Tax=Cohnella suwonensis TaxID=696072 RepID=A0ABW0LZJ1_9BACL